MESYGFLKIGFCSIAIASAVGEFMPHVSVYVHLMTFGLLLGWNAFLLQNFHDPINQSKTWKRKSSTTMILKD